MLALIMIGLAILTTQLILKTDPVTLSDCKDDAWFE
jgi:hypothetical protein